MKTPSQNFAHHTEVKKHPFGVKTPNLATLTESAQLPTQSLSSAFSQSYEREGGARRCLLLSTEIEGN